MRFQGSFFTPLSGVFYIFWDRFSGFQSADSAFEALKLTLF